MIMAMKVTFLKVLKGLNGIRISNRKFQIQGWPGGLSISSGLHGGGFCDNWWQTCDACCSLDLRKIMNAAKADESESTVVASSGSTGGTGEARFET